MFSFRFGRGDRNFLRFGRSVDRQKSSMSFENCDEEPKTHDVTSTPSPTPVQPMTRTKQQAATHSIASSDSDKTTSHRMKRNVSRVYGYITLPTHTRDINPEEDAINVAYSDEPQVVDKRGYNKGFLRFGRDRNFLRFGKRDVSGEYPTYSSISSSESSGSQLGERPARAHQRNFIRFGWTRENKIRAFILTPYLYFPTPDLYHPPLSFPVLPNSISSLYLLPYLFR